jgi:hypothetical protein
MKRKKKIFVGALPDPGTERFISLATRDAAASLAAQRVEPGELVVITTGVWEATAHVLNRKVNGKLTTQARIVGQPRPAGSGLELPTDRKERRRAKRKMHRKARKLVR